MVSVLIGICAPGRVLPKDNPQNVPQKTVAGITFTTPGAGTVASDSGMITVTAPESDTHVSVLDEKVPDAATAVSEAWTIYKPGFARPVRASVNIPDHDGWKDGRQFAYQASPNVTATLLAIPYHNGALRKLPLRRSVHAGNGRAPTQVRNQVEARK